MAILVSVMAPEESVDTEKLLIKELLFEYSFMPSVMLKVVRLSLMSLLLRFALGYSFNEKYPEAEISAVKLWQSAGALHVVELLTDEYLSDEKWYCESAFAG
jgi:hypothetical protein